VLLAVTGLSPAVLTETVWALATQHRILPHRIVLLTTMEGKRHLEEKLFTPKKEGRNKSVWEAPRTELGASADQLKIDGYRIMTGPADIHSLARELEDTRN
jgi:CRISPR-associated protein (TIGR02584 family)